MGLALGAFAHCSGNATDAGYVQHMSTEQEGKHIADSVVCQIARQQVVKQHANLPLKVMLWELLITADALYQEATAIYGVSGVEWCYAA